MKFDTSKMTEADLRASKIYKKLQKALGGIAVMTVEADPKLYKSPTSGNKIYYYTLSLTSGQELSLGVNKDTGEVERVVLFNENSGTKDIDSASSSETSVDQTPQSIGREVNLANIRDKKVVKKISTKALAKLAQDNSLEEETRLRNLGSKLKQGSGYWIVLNKEGLFLSHLRDEYTKRQSQMAVFSTEEQADGAMNNTDRKVQL